MKPAPFDFIAAQDWPEALESIAEYGDEASVIAGGQSLMAMLNMRLAKPSVLIDINSIKPAYEVQRDRDSVRFGAAVRQAALELGGNSADAHPLLSEAIKHVGHVQTRARGTICGSICHADPSSELPLCLVASAGTVELATKYTRREIAAVDFFRGPLTTMRRPDEIMVSVKFPKAQPGQAHAFKEIAERHGDFALASFAAIVSRGKTRLAVGAAADRPVARDWPTDSLSDLQDALNDFAWDLGGNEDHHASARYRRSLVRTVGLETIRAAQQRLNAQESAA